MAVATILGGLSIRPSTEAAPEKERSKLAKTAKKDEQVRRAKRARKEKEQ